MAVWEYRIVLLNLATSTIDEETLNTLGQYGWELVAVTTGVYDMPEFAYLKRRKG